MRKKFPFYFQEGIKDCASASILMILKYYKGNINHIKLNEMLKTSRKGTTAFHIVETLNKLGFHAEGIKTDINGIKHLPVIAHVIINHSYKHYVVIYQIDFKKKTVLVADPAKGFVTYSFNKFEEIWNGIIITMYPIKKIVNENSSGIVKFIYSLIKPYKFKIIKIGILSFLITIQSIIISFIFHLIFNPTLKIILLFLFIVLFKIILEYIRNNLLLKMTNKIDADITMKSFAQIINLPYNYYQGRTSGEIISRITDLKIVKNFISQMIITLFTDLPFILLSFICLIYLNKMLSFITLIVLTIIIVITCIYHGPLKKQIYLTKLDNSDNMSFMTEATLAFETIKGLKLENKIISTFKMKYNKFLKSHYKLGKTYNKQFLLKDLNSNIGNLLIILIGIYLVKNHFLNFNNFITIVILLSFLIDPIKNITNLNLEFSDFLLSLKRIIDITSYKVKLNNNSSNFIRLKNIDFSFDDHFLTLNNINLKINEGEKIILAGNSGSGKSTLLKLLMKYYMPLKGTVMTKEKITYVSQNEKLFTGTMENNLTFYQDNNLSRIIKVCCLEEVINKDDLKLKQLIEEDGFNFSGGEKQRIVLARALMKNFDALIIDEALNEVDISMERKILKNIFKEFQNKTIIFVSHRLDNIDIFDRLIKMQNGKIIFDEKKNKGD